MAICPIDLKPCCNDICYGGGCLKLIASGNALPLLTHCDCGELIGIDGTDPYDACTCDPEEEYPLDYEEPRR